MSAIHELRADYRHFRTDHPRLGWLFTLLDIIFTLVKFAIVAGMLAAVWYLMNRGSTAPQTNGVAVAGTRVEVQNTTEVKSPALTAERLAILRKIQRQSTVAQDTTKGDESMPKATEVAAKTVPVDTNSAGQSQPIVVSVQNNQTSQTQAQLVRASVADAAVAGASGVDASSDRAATMQDGSNKEPEIITAPGNDWILEQPPRNFTLQIAMTVNKPFLESFADKLPSEHLAAIYPERITSTGDIAYSLSIGTFASQAVAEKVLAALPEVHKRYGAHLRRFEELQGRVTDFGDSISQ